MRIAVIAHSAHLVGGAEEYVDAVIPELRRAGHYVALCTEAALASSHLPPLDSARLAAPFVLTDADALGPLASWRPDVLFMHGLHSSVIERALVDSYPAVFMAHAYHGTCISGSKTRSLPRPTPCSRTLGPGCAVQYFPRRCGGLSPVTLLEQYRLQRERQRLLPRYARVLTLSEHIRLEYVRHGVASDRAWVLPYFAPSIDVRQREVATLPDAPVRLLFAGRMEHLKGGSTLLAALPRIAAALNRSVSVVFAGDGRCRAAWEQHASQVAATHATVRIEFVGWLSEPELERALLRTDLLIVPSIGPEPFGLIGPRAAAAGVPAAAFATGGIPQWLTDGVTGHLATSPETTPFNLARAAIRCLEDREHFGTLQRQAKQRAAEHTLAAHVQALLGHLQSGAGQHTLNAV